MASASGDDASMASASGVFVGGGVARPAATSAFSFAGDGDECEFSLEVASFSDAGRRAGDGGARRPGFGSLSRSAWTSIANPNPNGFPRRFVRRWSGLRSRAPPEVEVDVSRAGDLGAAISGADRDLSRASSGIFGTGNSRSLLRRRSETSSSAFAQLVMGTVRSFETGIVPALRAGRGAVSRERNLAFGR
jgi:hypothetical protein